MKRHPFGMWSNKRGAVAPTVALSMFALIAAGGIAFDYARLASLDTELQNAADQAALAAATQLDGETGACARAAAAAAGLLSNQTVFANETAARAITVTNESGCDATGVIRFYQSYNQITDTPGPAATGFADARVVHIQVNPREAVYALTPVVGAFRSGQIRAEAIAALGSAICKVPPVMMCNPAEPDSNTDVNLDFTANEGDGLRLVIGSPDAPGNFGFLRTGEDGGAKEVAKTVGYDVPPSGCFKTNGVETEPGNMISVRAAFNTRFDISENGETTCPKLDGGGAGVCSPSRNSRKDLVRPSSGALCTLHSDGWHEAAVPYRAPNSSPLSDANPMIPDDPDTVADEKKIWPDAMGYSRDLCHAVSVDGSCTPNLLVGTGDWDIDAYFKVNHGMNQSQWMAAVTDEDGNLLATTTADIPNVSRYDVYKWEMMPANAPTKIDVDRNVPTSDLSIARPVCRGAGIEPSETVPDRRRIAVAVVNCKAQKLKGHKTNVQVRKWLDVFLVEPAVARGNGPSQRSRNGDIYVEIIQMTSSGGEETAQVIRRDVPYLIR